MRYHQVGLVGAAFIVTAVVLGGGCDGKSGGVSSDGGTGGAPGRSGGTAGIAAAGGSAGRGTGGAGGVGGTGGSATGGAGGSATGGAGGSATGGAAGSGMAGAGGSAGSGAGGNGGGQIACGSSSCDASTSFCYSYIGGVPGSTTSHSCAGFPPACATNRTCACVCPPNSGMPGCAYSGSFGAYCNCGEGNGGISVSCAGQ